MDSEVKPDNPDREEAASVFTAILDRLKPVLFRRWRKSSREAKQVAKAAGVTDVDAYMAGFQKGYWSGAVDVSKERLKPKDLLPAPVLAMTKTKVH